MIKKIILLFLICQTVQSQKLITEGKIALDNDPLKATFLPNLDQIVIEFGEKTNKEYKSIIKNVIGYNTDGHQQNLIQNDQVTNLIFSPIEKAFLIGKLPKGNKYPDEYKLVLDGVASNYFKIDKYFRFFTDLNGISIVNEKDNPNINLEKDNLFLKRINLFTNEERKIQMEKPNLFRLENKTTTTYKEGLNFDIRISENTISFITKSINKNYKSSTLYRTVYDLHGNKIGDYEYLISTPKKYQLFSNTGNGISLDTKGNIELNELSINNFIIDPKTNHTYIYGVFGNQASSIGNNLNTPSGFYVFKFDEKGNAVWVSEQEIPDATGLNQEQNLNQLQINLRVRKNDVLVSLSSDDKKFMNYTFLDSEYGNKLDEQKIYFSGETKETSEQFINSNYLHKSYINFKFDKNTLLAFQFNSKVLNYLDQLDKTKNIRFKTFFSKDGFWILESDNTSYYKILFFEEYI